jgi:hypothetical protein
MLETVRRKSYKKRPRSRLPFFPAPGLAIGIKLYSLVQKHAAKAASVLVSARTNETLVRCAALIDQKTGEELDPGRQVSFLTLAPAAGDSVKVRFSFF